MSDFKQIDMANIFADVVSKTAELSKKVDGDYIKDELLHCGKCHTKKQTRQINPFSGKEKIFPCVCQCERERMDREEFLKRVQQLKTEGIQDKNILDWTFAKDDGSNPKIKLARRYVDKWDEMYRENIGFLIYGDVGTGKTFFAACIANALLDKGIPAMVTSFSKLVEKMRDFKQDNNQFLNSLNMYKLLVIDDLGVERESEYVMEQVYNIIDSRYKNGQPMIITTNIPIAELKEPKDMARKRIYDRILENCVPIELQGESRRKKTNREKMIKARELFGI